MAEKLKPCPFCGGELFEFAIDDTTSKWNMWCAGCGADGPLAESIEEAAAAWNKRHDIRRETIEECALILEGHAKVFVGMKASTAGALYAAAGKIRDLEEEE